MSLPDKVGHHLPAFFIVQFPGEVGVYRGRAVVAVVLAVVDRRQPDSVDAGLLQMIQHIGHPGEPSVGGRLRHIDFLQDQGLDPVRAHELSAVCRLQLHLIVRKERRCQRRIIDISGADHRRLGGGSSRGNDAGQQEYPRRNNRNDLLFHRMRHSFLHYF